MPTLAQMVAQITPEIDMKRCRLGWDRKGNRRMVTPYVPDTGDIVFMDFDPQVGREQAKRGRVDLDRSAL